MKAPPPCPKCGSTRVLPWHECGEPTTRDYLATTQTDWNCRNGFDCQACGHSWDPEKWVVEAIEKLKRMRS